MLAELTDILGSGGTGALMLIASLSFLAWMPAIAAVVVGPRSRIPKILLLFTLAIFPPASLAVMAAAVKNAEMGETPEKKRRRIAFRSERCKDRRSHAARSVRTVATPAVAEA